MQSRDFHQIRHCPHKKIEMESISSRFNNDVVCVALISSWNGIVSNRINLQRGRGGISLACNNFIKLVQFRGGVGADCPMYTENPIFEPSPPRSVTLLFIVRFRIGSRLAGISLYMMSIYRVAPARKKLLFNVQWDLGADWLVLSKTETGEPLPPLHVCIVHPFNVQFQIALAIIFAKRPADCTLNSTVWLNQNWHTVHLCSLGRSQNVFRVCIPQSFHVWTSTYPNPQGVGVVSLQRTSARKWGEEGRIGTFVGYLVLINLTLNKRNNNNRKTASNAFLLEGWGDESC